MVGSDIGIDIDRWQMRGTTRQISNTITMISNKYICIQQRAHYKMCVQYEGVG